MVEDKNIPLTNDIHASKDYMRKAVDQILKNVRDEDLYDEFYEEALEDEFENAVPPTDKKKIH